MSKPPCSRRQNLFIVPLSQQAFEMLAFHPSRQDLPQFKNWENFIVQYLKQHTKKRLSEKTASRIY